MGQSRCDTWQPLVNSIFAKDLNRQICVQTSKIHIFWSTDPKLANFISLESRWRVDYYPMVRFIFLCIDLSWEINCLIVLFHRLIHKFWFERTKITINTFLDSVGWVNNFRPIDCNFWYSLLFSNYRTPSGVFWALDLFCKLFSTFSCAHGLLWIPSGLLRKLRIFRGCFIIISIC